MNAGQIRLHGHGDKGFRLDIQGLRGLAVAAVVVEHAFPALLPGGYVGVDIFFVISGFLISGIVARDIDRDRFSIVDFYRRRVRRIGPALITLLLATLLAGFFLLSPSAYMELARTTLATLFFVSNFVFAQLSGYFDGDAKLKPLLHMWSLAVEEQFYIFFPPFMLLFWKRFGAPRTQLVVIVTAAASLGVALLMQHLALRSTYYMLPPRAFELLIGTALGLGTFPALPSRALRDGASLLGLAMILVCLVAFGPATPIPGLAALVPCLGAALIIHAGNGGADVARHDALGGRLLSWAPLVFVGTVSYSLYLWHWPVLALMRGTLESDLPPLWAIAGVALAMLAATMSYYWVEQPFLAPRARGWHVLKLGAGGAALVGVLGLGLMLGHGLPQRFPAPVRQVFAMAQDYNHRRAGCHYDSGPRLIPYEASCSFGAQVRPDVAVWGDSHGAELAVVLGERAGTQGRSVRELTASACPPAQGFALKGHALCPELNRKTLDGLIADRAIHTVVLTVNAARYPDRDTLESGLRLSAQRLTQAGKSVILVKQIPIMPFDPPQRAGIMAYLGRPLDGLGADWGRAGEGGKDDDQAAEYDQWLDTLAAQQPGSLSIYDPKSILCRDHHCLAWRAGTGLLYFNGEHLGLTGARLGFAALADRLYPSGGALPH